MSQTLVAIAKIAGFEDYSETLMTFSTEIPISSAKQKYAEVDKAKSYERLGRTRK